MLRLAPSHYSRPVDRQIKQINTTSRSSRFDQQECELAQIQTDLASDLGGCGRREFRRFGSSANANCVDDSDRVNGEPEANTNDGDAKKIDGDCSVPALGCEVP